MKSGTALPVVALLPYLLVPVVSDRVVVCFESDGCVRLETPAPDSSCSVSSHDDGVRTPPPEAPVLGGGSHCLECWDLVLPLLALSLQGTNSGAAVATRVAEPQGPFAPKALTPGPWGMAPRDTPTEPGLREIGSVILRL